MIDQLNANERYFQQLIDEAERLLANRDFGKVATEVLVGHNNFRSGWTFEIDTMYFKPKTEEQTRMAEQMKNVILRTAQGMLPDLKPGKTYMEFSYILFISRLIYRLGVEAPSELVSQARTLIEDSRSMGANLGLILEALNFINPSEN